MCEKLIYARAGIALAENRQEMVYTRLSKRLRATGTNNFNDYLQRLERDSEDVEWGVIHQCADHQSDIVLPGSSPFSNAGRACEETSAWPHGETLVQRGFYRGRTLFDGHDHGGNL